MTLNEPAPDWHHLGSSVRSNGRALVLAFTAMAATSAPAIAQIAPPSGAASSSGCHAPAALGTSVPPIARHSAAEIVAAMEDYRAGRRPATVMDRIAKGFTPAETQAIAAWLAGRDAGAR